MIVMRFELKISARMGCDVISVNSPQGTKNRVYIRRVENNHFTVYHLALLI